MYLGFVATPCVSLKGGTAGGVGDQGQMALENAGGQLDGVGRGIWIHGLRQARASRNGTTPATTIAGTVDFATILRRDGWVGHICAGLVAPGELSFDHIFPWL